MAEKGANAKIVEAPQFVNITEEGALVKIVEAPQSVNITEEGVTAKNAGLLDLST